MRALPVLLAALLTVPALASYASSSDGSLGLVDPNAPAAPASHLSWSDTITGRGGAFCGPHGCTPLVPPDVLCDGSDCDSRPVEVHVPAGHWGANYGGLRVVLYGGSADWHTAAYLRVRDAGGAVVAEDTSGMRLLVAYLPSPADGAYTIEVQGITSGAYELDAFLESRSFTPPDLLPNLVPLVPADLHIGACRSEEMQEEGAKRCLRFSNAIVNHGEGALEVRMGAADTSLVLAGGSANWTQRVSTTGGFRDAPVGPAVWHEAHSHFHYDGLATYVVHHYDLVTGTRGAQWNNSQKAGFCLIDWDTPVDPARPYAGRYTYDGVSCLGPFNGGDIRMGISVGWYDLYDYSLSEQYVDVYGAPDGVYELVSYVNDGGGILESDLTDNSASVLFRLTGNVVENLGPP